MINKFSLTNDFNESTSSSRQNIGTKRLQVPRACIQCQKTHSGCDLERPCKRCVQNGFGILCDDKPRKKRVRRMKQNIGGNL